MIQLLRNCSRGEDPPLQRTLAVASLEVFARVPDTLLRQYLSEIVLFSSTDAILRYVGKGHARWGQLTRMRPTVSNSKVIKAPRSTLRKIHGEKLEWSPSTCLTTQTTCKTGPVAHALNVLGSRDCLGVSLSVTSTTIEIPD